MKTTVRSLFKLKDLPFRKVSHLFSFSLQFLGHLLLSSFFLSFPVFMSSSNTLCHSMAQLKALLLLLHSSAQETTQEQDSPSICCHSCGRSWLYSHIFILCHEFHTYLERNMELRKGVRWKNFRLEPKTMSQFTLHINT